MKMKNLFLVGLLALLSSVINLSAQLVGFSQYAIGGTATTVGTNWAIIPAELASQMENSQGIAVSPVPVITFLSCRAFTTGAAVLQSYYSTNSTVFTATGLTGELTTNQVAWPNGTNGFTAGQWCVIHHVPYTNSVSYTNVIYGQTNVVPKLVTSQLPDQIADEAVYIAAVPTTLNLITNTINNYPSPGLTNSIVTTNSYIAFLSNPLQTVNPNDELYQETAGAAISISSQGVITATTLNSGAGIFSGQRKKPLLLVLQAGSTAGTNTIDAVNSTFVP